jgi:arsenate reductase-like glutaredoxin family protein
MNMRPIDLIRINEAIYKKEYKGKNFTDDEWMIIITENPKLLRRPLVIARHKGIIGDPVEKIEAFLA